MVLLLLSLGWVLQAWRRRYVTAVIARRRSGHPTLRAAQALMGRHRRRPSASHDNEEGDDDDDNDEEGDNHDGNNNEEGDNDNDDDDNNNEEDDDDDERSAPQVYFVVVVVVVVTTTTITTTRSCLLSAFCPGRRFPLFSLSRASSRPRLPTGDRTWALPLRGIVTTSLSSTRCPTLPTPL